MPSSCPQPPWSRIFHLSVVIWLALFFFFTLLMVIPCTIPKWRNHFEGRLRDRRSDMTLFPQGGLPLCTSSALLHHRKPAHYTKQSGNCQDYRHMWTEWGIIKVLWSTWWYSNISAKQTSIHKHTLTYSRKQHSPSSINPQVSISAPIAVCQSKTNHLYMGISLMP